jgi:hypothetical protein
MTRLFEINPDAQEWIDGRPKVIKAMIAKTPPNLLYRLKPTGQRVTIYSYSEAGTVTVLVSGQYNLTDYERRVFGVNPDDLEECDLPGPNEPLGVLLNEEETEAYIRGVIAKRHQRGERHNEDNCPLCESKPS